MSEYQKIKKLLQLAEKYLIDGDIIRAEASSREIIEIDPGNFEAYYFLGEALCKRGKFEESIKSLQQANTLLPNHPQIIHLLGWVLFMNGQVKKGETYILKALKELPDNIQILCDLALIEISQGRGAEAKEYALKAIQKNPYDSQTQEVFQKVLFFEKSLTKLNKKISN